MDQDDGIGSDSSSFEDLSAQEFTNSNETATTNTNEEWLDVLGSGSLKKKILKEGDSNSLRPQRTDICTIRIEGKLENDVVVDKNDKMKVQIGDLEVVQGIDLILPLMNVGEISLVEIEPRLAYGEEGRSPDIPSNSKIVYEIELLKIEHEPELENIPILTRKTVGNKKRERGNWWYARKECNYAVQCYRRALDYLDDVEGGITEPTEDGQLKPTDADLQDLLEDRMKVYNNMAAAQMKLEAYDAALKCVDNVLMCQPQNVKALFRKAKILINKNEPEEANTILKKALEIDPTNIAVQKEILKLKTIAKKHRESERSMAKRMLQQSGQIKNNSNNSQKNSKLLLWTPIIGIVAVGIAIITAYKFKYD